MTASPPMPRNGRHFVAVLVGGDAVPFELGGEVFEEYGIAVEYRWFKERHIGTPPRDVDCILIMTDLSSAQMIREASKIAKSAHIPYALVGRKKAAWMNGLRISGFVQRPSWLKPSGQKKETLMQPTQPAPVTPMNGAPLRAPDAFERIAPTYAAGSKAAPVSQSTLILAPVKPETLTITTVGVDTSARYVPHARAWTDAEGSMVMQLAGQWKASEGARGFITRVWQATGNYRTPRALLFMLRGLRYLIGNAAIDLCNALRIEGNAEQKRRRAYLATEANEIAAGRMPAWVSRAWAARTLGREFPNAMVDREYGIHVLRRAEIMPLLEARRACGVQDGERMPSKVPGPENVKRDILDRLKKGPRRATDITRAKFGPYVLEQLLKEGLIVSHAVEGRTWYALPGQPVPARQVVAGDVGKHEPNVVVVNNAAPRGEDDARREVFRALRAGDISAKDAAALLRELGGQA